MFSHLEGILAVELNEALSHARPQLPQTDSQRSQVLLDVYRVSGHHIVLEELLEGLFELGLEVLHHLDLEVWQLQAHTRDLTAARWRKDQIYDLLNVIRVLYLLYLLVLLDDQTFKVFLVHGKLLLLCGRLGLVLRLRGPWHVTKHVELEFFAEARHDRGVGLHHVAAELLVEAGVEHLDQACQLLELGWRR